SIRGSGRARKIAKVISVGVSIHPLYRLFLDASALGCLSLIPGATRNNHPMALKKIPPRAMLVGPGREKGL
ncbi:MAG: hypothetical protein LBM64_10545, partial [Deltaproteobacteria bacterium]|nr:hypothetical protein [Deltaproteobacteria bacterium]